MNIVICGAGEVGRHAAEVLSTQGHNITVIDLSVQKLAVLEDTLDIRSLIGDATHAETLLEAGVARADLLVAATHIDQINLIAASAGKALGAGKCIARVHHAAFFERRGLDYGRHLGIDHLVCPEYSTALAIAATLRSPGALAVENFARGMIEMQSLRVGDSAKAVGQSLQDLRLPGSARLAAIEREGKAFVPGASTVIHAGDVVTIIGDTSHFDKVKKVFQSGADRRLKVMIMGGTSQAVWLCRALQPRNFSVRLFETDKERAVELAEKLDRVTVLHADVINTGVLQEERVDQADAFVALTDDDETNILAAAQAKTNGVPSAIAVLQRATYLHLLHTIGIDRAFSPRATAVSEIRRLLEEGRVRHLASLAEGIAEVFELRVSEEASHVTGKPLRELRLPPRCLIAAVHRDSVVFVPGAQSVLQPGDMLIVIGPAQSQKTIQRAFS